MVGLVLDPVANMSRSKPAGRLARVATAGLDPAPRENIRAIRVSSAPVARMVVLGGPIRPKICIRTTNAEGRVKTLLGINLTSIL